MSKSNMTVPPDWADNLRSRYLRGESCVFVLHGNVHDLVYHDDAMIGLSDYLAHSVLEKKDLIIRFNVSTGCRFVKKTGPVEELETLLAERSPAKVLPVLEHLLLTTKNTAIIVEYAEMVAPEGSIAFATEQDRLALVTLQRWSLSPDLDERDNIVLLLTETPSELHTKITSNPRIGMVKIPMPDIEERRRAIQLVNDELTDDWTEKFADITAGLKLIQLRSILRPPEASSESNTSRFEFIVSQIGNESRAKKLAAVTHGMSWDEILEIIGVEPKETADEPEVDPELEEVTRLIGRRKREIIESECLGLIEFVGDSHDFSVVGGIEEIKKNLKTIARNIRDGRKNMVPMGLLFTGPMGTGKTFVAEAFVKESGLTGIKFKNFRSKWVGATESNLERILNVVQAIGNVIVIIDEGDRSFGSGNADDGGVSSRVIARLKEFMSDTTNRGRVLFILMTNRPDKLDIDIKRAGRLDRKIPFLYGQTPEAVESVLLAQFRKHQLEVDITFPADRAKISEPLVGYSNADLEALVLLAHNYADEALEDRDEASVITKAELERAIDDYLPPRDEEMLEYMELLAVFEASNRRMLPAKYANLSKEELQSKLAALRLRCGDRR